MVKVPLPGGLRVPIPGVPGVGGIARMAMAAQGESEETFSRKERRGFRRLGYVLISVGFVLFMFGAPLFFILRPPGVSLTWGIAVVLIGMAVLMAGGLFIAWGHADLSARTRRGAEGDLLEGSRETLLRRAQNLVTAERLEEAAQIYEHLGMYQEAGELRRRARAQVVTHVQVDMNDLIEKMKSGGISTDYDCPSCGAATHITGETSAVTLRSCRYCGVAFHTADVTKLLARVTGYS